jgi:excisionase family DNA binding protein
MEQRRWYTVADAATYLSVSRYAIRDAVWQGILPYVRMGKRFIFDRHDLDRWAESKKRLEPAFG